MKKYRVNNNIVFSNKYHIIWCTKYRRQLLENEIKERLKEIIKEECSNRNAEILELEIMPEHIHILLEVDPQYGIHRMLKQIKGASSRKLRNEFPELRTRIPTLWTNSYFVSTVGNCASLEEVQRYIQNQQYTCKVKGDDQNNINKIKSE